MFPKPPLGPKYGAVGVGVPVKDTIKVASHDGFITETPPGAAVGHPDAASISPASILAAHEAAAAEGSRVPTIVHYWNG